MSRLPRSLSFRSCAALLAAGVAAAAGTARATWSIVICNTRTGEVAVASATCLTNFDLQANTPVLIVGVGGGTAQSSVDSNATNRTFMRDRLYAGMAPADIVTALSSFDGAHQSRQYGIADVLGRTATFSGSGAGMWKGGTTGVSGDLVYAVQGNVLWGPLVVDDAVAAIVNTPGDVPAKLMAAMKAARVEGGDGRCSCSNANPDGCTTLPTSFKSAHIAYMLIGRAGDRDGSNGNYKFTGYANAAEPGDFNGDGKPDVVACGTAGVGVFPNVTFPGQAPMLGTAINTAVGYTPRDMVAADFNADGKMDVAITNNAADTINVLMGNGNGTFAAPATYAAGDAPVGLAAGDLNGDVKADLVVANANSDSCSVYLNNGSGGLTGPVTVLTGDGSQTVVLGDVDADGDLDMLVGNLTAKTLSIFKNDGAGSFTAGTVITYSQYPIGMDVGDLNGDGRPDLLVTNNGDSLVKIHLQNADGTFAQATYSTAGAAGNGYLRDLDADGKLDMLVLQKPNSRMYVFKGAGDGTFAAGKVYPIGFSPTSMRLADLDGDGDVDPVIRIAGGIGCLMLNAGGGTFDAVSGLAGGDYFMQFNVANQSASNRDPVDQCEDLFAAWRASLVGKVDAVQSIASFDPTVIHADGVSGTTLKVRAKDWQLADVSLAGANVSVTVEGDSLVTTGSSVLNADGTVDIPVTGKTSCGTAVFEVTVTGLGRKVVLMPKVALTVSDPADFDNSGFVDTNDYDAFVGAFEAGTQDADFDRSGFVDTDDFTAFVLRFENPC